MNLKGGLWISGNMQLAYRDFRSTL